MQTISLSDLVTILSAVRGARFATITALTDARLLKTGNPFGKVMKLSRVNVVINHKYENSVNNQRTREGNAADFTAQPRKWGERVKGTPFVTHNGRVYLECGVQKTLSHEYLMSCGERLTDLQVAPFQPTKASNADHQGVEREIILRDYAIDTLQNIVIDGETYAIDPATIAPAVEAMANSMA